jgi:hypothetical protein
MPRNLNGIVHSRIWLQGLTFSECRHVDDSGVVSFELLDQLLGGHIPDEDVLSHPSDGSVLPLQNAGKVYKSS